MGNQNIIPYFLILIVSILTIIMQHLKTVYFSKNVRAGGSFINLLFVDIQAWLSYLSICEGWQFLIPLLKWNFVFLFCSKTCFNCSIEFILFLNKITRTFIIVELYYGRLKNKMFFVFSNISTSFRDHRYSMISATRLNY